MQKLKKKLIWIIGGLVLAGILAVVVIVSAHPGKYYRITDIEGFSQWHNKIIYKGAKYHKNKDISPILFLGIDHAYVQDDAIYLGRGGRSDAIYVFLMNKKEKTITLLAVSRDSMTEVDVYNPEGEYYFSGVMQVTMQYAYGSSPEKSCKLSEKTISEMLLNLDFDAHISVSLTAVSKVVDMLGGITITMPDDYSWIDPRFAKGAIVTLNGEDADLLLHKRDITQLESNNDRMKRHTLLIETVVKELKDMGIVSHLSDILKIAKEDISTNAGLGKIRKLATYELSEEHYTVPGDTRAGTEHAEFYVDDYALMDLLIDLLYVKEE